MVHTLTITDRDQECGSEGQLPIQQCVQLQTHMKSPELYLHTAWKSTTTSLEPAALSSESNSAADAISLTILLLVQRECSVARRCSGVCDGGSNPSITMGVKTKNTTVSDSGSAAKACCRLWLAWKRT